MMLNTVYYLRFSHHVQLWKRHMSQKILIIVGPTASGKSALAISLARAFGGEVISADSRQVYRGLDIGTAKIGKRQMHGVPHHLLDEVSPRRTFTAHDFSVRAQKAITGICRRGRLPIVAGGTGFYIDALVGNWKLPSAPPDKRFRARLEKKTAAQLFAMLKKKDPRRARTIEHGNKRRLIRALEIAHALKLGYRSNISGLRSHYIPKKRFDALWIGISPADKKLRALIVARAQKQIRAGLLSEVKGLRARGLSWKRLHELGFEYALAADVLRKKIPLAAFADKLTSSTWRYARKQKGYWKRNASIRWFRPPEARKIMSAVRTWLW